jgi:hypothetical protein
MMPIALVMLVLSLVRSTALLGLLGLLSISITGIISLPVAMLSLE